jgi:2',3'-cyclic-nucleotide 2'-phosphodiesterase (5'-nucleotidase family)
VPLIVLDGGDFFHRKGSTNTAESILTWDEMVNRRYDAVTFGEHEFREWALAESLMTANPLPVVCTNVERQVGLEWQTVGERYLLIERAGIRIGVISAIDETQLSENAITRSGQPLRVLPPVQTAREMAIELREKVDLVILLAHVEKKTMEQYATSLPEVDLIVGGHMTQKDEVAKQFGHAIVNRSGTRGMHLAYTRLIVSPQNQVVDFGGNNVTLTKDLPEDPLLADLAEKASRVSTRQRSARNAERRRQIQEKVKQSESSDRFPTQEGVQKTSGQSSATED